MRNPRNKFQASERRINLLVMKVTHRENVKSILCLKAEQHWLHFLFFPFSLIFLPSPHSGLLPLSIHYAHYPQVSALFKLKKETVFLINLFALFCHNSQKQFDFFSLLSRELNRDDWKNHCKLVIIIAIVAIIIVTPSQIKKKKRKKRNNGKKRHS